MMLNGSFKPAKCKTALKLAVSRMKFLKNKSEAQVKKLRRELAELLESGSERAARIRVQHLVKEEKTRAAYELIQMFCEFIVIRFPIIESQKICPTDLKEAIASVVFAYPRCADDIPELLDVKKQMTAKYGKEFISAAVELRPQCGVNRLLVEKLSPREPDGPTKVKVLSAIAEEYDVKWEPNPFGDIDHAKSLHHDLQDGCEESSPHAHAPPAVHGEKEYPNFHAHYSHQHKQINDVPTITNLYVRNTSFASENAGGSGNRLKTTYRPFPEIRSSENVASRAASESPIHGNGIRQFSAGSRISSNGSGSGLSSEEEAEEYSVHDAKHVSAEKASHVHPRLPEYDSIAAHFRSLKLNN